LILTNAHVVEGIEQITVHLKDGRQLEGQVLGADRVTDVAVVKVAAAGLPAVPLGNSDQLEPGQWAIAIGNPLGLDNTVTVGIISAVNRSSREIGAFHKQIGFIQTDAAINPGNSGGPLLNASGEVIGMNTAIIGGAQGLGFAIPINTVEQLALELATTGKVQHPFVGIQMVDLTPAVQARLEASPELAAILEKVADQQGVLIVEVLPNSPAALAGLRPGDVIQRVASQPVTTAMAVQQQVAKGRVGQPLNIEVLRPGGPETIAVTPVERSR
jgi:S1-C subfamily serine protease